MTSKLNESLNSGTRFIVVDEMSMVDLPIFLNLLKYVQNMIIFISYY